MTGMQYPEFENKIVIVTGGSSGIGRAAALAFAKNAAKVVVAARSQQGCDETCELISKEGGTAIAVATDICVIDQIESLVKRTISKYGGLDFAFNNAGTIGESQMLFEIGEDEWDRVINTNLKSVWAMMKVEIPEIKKQGSGAIVNTSSVAGIKAAPTYSVYAASKAGVNSLTATAANEMAASGIRINAICPGFINTAMSDGMDAEIQKIIEAGIPLGRRGEPEEVANLALWLCSDQASYLTGQTLRVDGGSSS
ncbi:MAG: NAD(P)-dependent dehydrogenase (short-subunit alcohol dehydrogenase family) [Gammaproteobacteria bacterium]|jgi:NAD(P)-dependent dehydrogenase (short-subunit alcohol dehydrogenase family)